MFLSVLSEADIRL